MKNKLVLLSILICSSLLSSAQQYLYIDDDGIRKFLRVDMGYAQWSMQQQDSATRMARGIHLLNEVKIITGFWNTDWAVTVHDAFYLSLDMGLLANPQHAKGIGIAADKESKFSTTLNMGYLAMTGYRGNKWAALGGIDFRWRSARVGDLTMPNLDGPLFYFSRPIVGRIEYAPFSNPDFRIMLTGWTTLKETEKRVPYQSLRFEIPLSGAGRTWLCFTYCKQKALSEDVFYFTSPASTLYSQWMIGIRIGNLP